MRAPPYLSTQGPNAINARDHIGNGPWYNQRGQVIAEGPYETVSKNPQVLEAYMGSAEETLSGH